MPRKSSKDKEILEFIRRYIKNKGFPPSVREIAASVGLKSTSAVHAQLNKLEKAGCIVKDVSKTRAIKLVENTFQDTEPECFSVPVLGMIRAGEPVYADENVLDYFPLPMSFAKNKDVFMLKVFGDSMVDAAILDGDYIIVAKQSLCSNGEIVVALIDDKATVKTFYKENGHFKLQPENPNMAPIIVDEVSILGKVIGVFRTL